MRQRALVLSLLFPLAFATAAGCYMETAQPFSAGDPDSGSDPGTPPAVDDAGHPVATGVPCAIETILATSCWSCHGVKPSAPSRLVTYADLTAPSKNNPQLTEAEAALARMQSTTSPMPPSGPKPSATDVKTFSDWVAAQTPQGAKCGGSSDAGISEDAAPVQSPYDTPVQCSSNKKWTSGTGSSMRPGDACNRCHSMSIGGTVYPTAHEPTNCVGIPGGATVTVTDAKNKTVNITVNSAGNFYYDPFTPLTPPYAVKVTAGSKVRAMTAKATSGDCNSCHTQSGAQNAPGRIMAP